MAVGEVGADDAALGERVADWYAEANLARAGTVAELAEGAWAMRTPAYPKSFAHNAVLVRRDFGADALVEWADDVLADADHRYVNAECDLSEATREGLKTAGYALTSLVLMARDLDVEPPLPQGIAVEPAAREDLATLPGRLAAVDEVEAAVAAATATRDRWEVAAALEAAGVPASPVEDVGDLVARDPMANGFLEEIQHPAGVSMLLQHEPITWNGERLPIQRAPFMGEHTVEILGSLLGMSVEDVATLVAEGVLQ